MEKKKAKTMQLETIKDLLNWSYANLAAYQIALKQDPPHYTRSCWMTRAKLFKGLQTGNMTRQSIYKNERDKLDKKDQCAYCGATGIPLTLDHVLQYQKEGVILEIISYIVASLATHLKGRRIILCG